MSPENSSPPGLVINILNWTGRFRIRPWIAIIIILVHQNYQAIQPLELYIGLANLLRVLAIHSVWKQKSGVNYSEVVTSTADFHRKLPGIL